jgi:phosphoribosylamine---glycine ligase
MSRPPEHLKVLEAGKDARTDVLVAGTAVSPLNPEISGMSEFNAPGMMQRCARFLGGVSLSDVDQMMAFAREVNPDLAIIGPEEPLFVGLVNRLEDELSVACFGPRSELARIETSKSWARDLVARYGIEANPRYRVFREPTDLNSYLLELGAFVIKPDGLTGGKGVKVFGEHLDTMADALDYARALIQHDGLVLIEERLEGEEFSLQTITDGETVVHCPLVQDHKRAFEDDEGPNTGGMGSYSCRDHSLPFLSREDVEAAQSVNERVVEALRSETGRPYRGVLYGGFIATAEGVKLIEYNARFGDPEATNVLPLLSSDLLDVCWSAATGDLAGVDVRFEPKATVCKYVVPRGYPNGKGAGDPIEVDFSETANGNTRMYWAAVNQIDSRLLLTGSRALAFVGIGDTLEEAERYAEAGAVQVRGPVRHRSDIGTPAAVARSIEHMRKVRQ